MVLGRVGRVQPSLQKSHLKKINQDFFFDNPKKLSDKPSLPSLKPLNYNYDTYNKAKYRKNSDYKPSLDPP